MTAKAPLPESLAIWTGYLLSRAAQRMRDRFEVLLEPLGLKGRHYSLLALLAEQAGLCQSEMGERLGIDRNSMVQLLDDLEERGLVERRRDPKDRRAHCVTLTEAGGALLPRMTELVRQVNDEALAPLTTEQRTQLHDLLGRLL